MNVLEENGIVNNSNPYRAEIRSCGKGKVLLVSILRSVHICSLHVISWVWCSHWDAKRVLGNGMILAGLLTCHGGTDESKPVISDGSRDFWWHPYPTVSRSIRNHVPGKPTNLGRAGGCGDTVTCHLECSRVKSLSPQLLQRLWTHRINSEAQSRRAPWGQEFFLGGHIQGLICALVWAPSYLGPNQNEWRPF